jgi:hypothetical protein
MKFNAPVTKIDGDWRMAFGCVRTSPGKTLTGPEIADVFPQNAGLNT